MKNMKVKSKLFVSFSMLVVLAVAVGIVGIAGMTRINGRADYMYSYITEPLPYLARIQETLQNARVQVREMVLSATNGDMDGVESAMTKILGLVEMQEGQLNLYEATLTRSEESAALFYQARDLYENQLIETVGAIYEACKIQDFDEIYRRMETCRILSEDILGKYDTILNLTVARAEEASADADSTANASYVAIFLVLIFVIGCAIALTAYITSIIGKPLGFMSRALEQIGVRGDLAIPADIGQSAGECMTRKDEIGLCARSFGVLIESLTNTSNTLQELSRGNFAVSATELSPADATGKSLKLLIDSLNNMFGEINSASSQVTTGSNQISCGAQALASGATQQAATLQEISASISDIAVQTQENAERTANASDLAGTIMHNAEKGNRQMEQMISAVNEINQANQSISKVIKVIDDIAFQTNILALNAAVEAARAGAAGKGFAVVAEEVRNLAAKSAESAKDTSGLIENSIQKAELGTQIAGETAESLQEIVSGITQSNRIIGEIAQSSGQQNMAINQINTAISGVTQVVQQNSATAEESAAASQEMSGQASMLEGLMSNFKLR
jgi:methyl-accepting chemotaxis protein